ncbi:hypothetical protein BDD12DRAFT_502497 [Trichophaea hybrida]|nr:hypothetical protein BDD12DRAFT_502497 [Trichophaea hybrida]
MNWVIRSDCSRCRHLWARCWLNRRRVLRPGTFGRTGWRWCFWVQLVLSSVLSVNWVWYPETFQSILIERKRKKLRFEAKENPHPSVPKLELFGDAIWRPLQLLFSDPIVVLASLYISFLFGVLHTRSSSNASTI